MWRCYTRFISSKEGITIAYFNQKSRPEKRFDPINEHVRYPEVLVIGPEGEQLGKMSSRAANELAASYNLDLYCVAPNANPPVCKILNYGKLRYEQAKQARNSKRNQHIVETKVIKLHVNIGAHDIGFKVKNAHGFIADGDKVQVAVILKGREMAHQEIGEEVLRKFVEMMSDVAVIEKAPNWEGKWYQCVIAPKKK